MRPKYFCCVFLLMERKKEAKASTAAIRTCCCQWAPEKANGGLGLYRSVAVGEAALEGAHDDVFMLLLYYAGRCREDAEGGLALPCIVGPAGAEEGAEQFRPCNPCGPA